MNRFTKKFKFWIWAQKGSIFEQITQDPTAEPGAQKDSKSGQGVL